MITATIENNELIVNGEPIVDEVYPGWCCAGFDLIVVAADTDPRIESMTVACQNPNCPNGDPEYIGINGWLIENFALEMTERNESSAQQAEAV